MTPFTYVNYLRLNGDELDADFAIACKEHGIESDTKVDIFPVRSVTGHDAYIVTESDKED